FLLTCDGFRFNSPIVVESLDSQPSVPTYPNPPQMVSTSQDRVQILEAGHDGTYTIYWVDKKANSPNQVQGVYSQQLNNTQTLGPFKRITGASAIPQLVFGFAAPGTTYQFVEVPDTLLPGNAPD